MHPFTSATLAATRLKLENAIFFLEEYAETCGEGVKDPQSLFSRGYSELYQLRGLLRNMAALEQMAERMVEADADRSPMMVIR